MSSPDPVSEPKAYQDLLVSLVAGEDPAEVQAATPGIARDLLAKAADRAALRPEPAEWSVLECVGHLVDAEIVYSGRYRWILAHDEPPLIGYDQDRWVDRLRHREADAERLLRVFETLREANVDLWRTTPAAERDRVGLHAERGPESFGLSFTLIAGHDRFHLQQAERALRAQG